MSAVTLSHGLRRLMCARRGGVLRLQSLAHHMLFWDFFSNVRDLVTLTKLNTEMRIFRTKFGIVTHIISSVINAQLQALIFRG